MRNILVLAIIFGSVPFCFISPYFGVLMWTWIAYFAPHRFAFGFVQTLPVAEIVALPTLAGLIFTRKLNRRIFTLETMILLAFWIWMAGNMVYIMTVPEYSNHVSDALFRFERVSKILLMTFVMIFVVNSKKKFDYLWLLTGGSLGLLGLKGALFGIRTAGESRVVGPPDTFIADNNDFALALNIAIPVIFFLARSQENRHLRRILYVLFFSCIVGVILTYSRGGLLGLAVVLSLLVLTSKRKILALSLVSVCAMLVFSLAPSKWMDRMSQFAHGDVDESAEQRFAMWRFAWNFAEQHPISGGGFGTLEDPHMFAAYAPANLPGKGYNETSAHSSYFEVLAEQGFVGFFLFLALLSGSWFALSRLRRRARRNASIAWMVPYTQGFQVSLLAFMVNGATLGRAYFDLLYQLIASVIVLQVLYRAAMREAAEVSDTIDIEETESELSPA